MVRLRLFAQAREAAGTGSDTFGVAELGVLAGGDGATVAYPRTVDTAEHEGFSAWCFALTRESMAEHSVAPGAFFDPDMVVWFQDSDLMVRLQRAGSPPRRVAESRIRHGRSLSVNTPDPRLREWIVEQIERDRCSFEAKTGLIAVEGTA